MNVNKSVDHGKSVFQTIEVKPKKTIEMVTKNVRYPTIIRKHNLKMTMDRLNDFRSTMQEIINVKNGILPKDADDDFVMNEMDYEDTVNITNQKTPKASRKLAVKLPVLKGSNEVSKT